MLLMATVLTMATVGKKLSMKQKNTMLMVSGEGFSTVMNVVATYIPAVPMRCRMPKTIWEGRKRSAIMPTKNGLIIPAIGPTE